MKRKEYLEKLNKAYQILLDLYEDKQYQHIDKNYLLENTIDNIDNVLNHNMYFMIRR